MPKSRQRCSTSLSSSSKVPSSSSSSTRSRAVSLPSPCCRSRRSGPPPSSARRTLSRRTSVRSANARLRPHLLLRLLPVVEEALQANVGQRVLQEAGENGHGHGAHVGPDLGRLHHVDG